MQRSLYVLQSFRFYYVVLLAPEHLVLLGLAVQLYLAHSCHLRLRWSLPHRLRLTFLRRLPLFRRLQLRLLGLSLYLGETQGRSQELLRGHLRPVREGYDSADDTCQFWNYVCRGMELV